MVNVLPTPDCIHLSLIKVEMHWTKEGCSSLLQ